MTSFVQDQKHCPKRFFMVNKISRRKELAITIATSETIIQPECMKLLI